LASLFPVPNGVKVAASTPKLAGKTVALLVTESAPEQTSSVRLKKIPVLKYRESKSVAEKTHFSAKYAKL
jgi:hypothetical protein